MNTSLILLNLLLSNLGRLSLAGFNSMYTYNHL